MIDEEELEEEELDPSILLSDGNCWVADPYYLDPEAEYEGVLAMQYKDGALWWLSGKTRKWADVEQTQSKKPLLTGVK